MPVLWCYTYAADIFWRQGTLLGQPDEAVAPVKRKEFMRGHKAEKENHQLKHGGLKCSRSTSSLLSDYELHSRKKPVIDFPR